MGRPKSAKNTKDIDPDYLKFTVSWHDRLAKYAELSTLEFYLSKYEVIKFLDFLSFKMSKWWLL
jgi:hypothetical protein